MTDADADADADAVTPSSNTRSYTLRSTPLSPYGHFYISIQILMEYDSCATLSCWLSLVKVD